jgi:ABC-type branched-subunit amino acid transport system permease subunit
MNVVKKKFIALIISGIILSFLGILWFLQGSDLVHINPILCFADCTPITGKSVTWQIAGGVVFVIGVVILAACLKNREKI